MNPKLSKWGRSYLTSVLRHVGSVGMGWVGTNLVNGTPGLTILKSLPIALIFGAVIPTTFTALQNTPDLDSEDAPQPPQPRP